MTLVLLCVLSSGGTSEKEKLPYWFDERHKCWLRLLVTESDLMSTQPICVRISGNEELLDFDTQRSRHLNTSDIVFFNNNPNDNLCLNWEYYKSLHWYKWDLRFRYTGKEDYDRGIFRIRNTTPQNVFLF